jgi:hypothetical protein
MTTREDAAAATTWEEWVASQQLGSAGLYAARVWPLPYALDWQRNPDAPCPPGFVWARCLCNARPVREATVRRYRPVCGWQLSPEEETGAARYAGCGAPLVRVARPDDPYPAVWVGEPDDGTTPAQGSMPDDVYAALLRLRRAPRRRR